MKEFKCFLSVMALVCCSLCLITGCRQASKYADDIWKAVDDKVDDGIRIKPPKKMPKQKTCGTCHGSGSVYDIYGYRYECSNCGGDGKVWIDF